MTLALVVDLELDDVEIGAVVIQRLYLQPRDRVEDARDSPAALLAVGGHIVVGNREVGADPPGMAPGKAQALEGLG